MAARRRWDLDSFGQEVRQRLADNVRSFRQRRGWTQQLTAQALDMSLQHYQSIEGARVNIPFDTLIRVASAFEVDPAAVLQRNAVAPEPAALTLLEQQVLNVMRSLSLMDKRRIYDYARKLERKPPGK